MGKYIWESSKPLKSLHISHIAINLVYFEMRIEIIIYELKTTDNFKH